MGGSRSAAVPPPTGAWATLIDPTPVGASSGWAGFTDRQTYLVGAYSGGAPATGTKIRVTFRGPSSGQTDIIAAYVGHQGAGDAYDFDGNQVQLKVSNSGAFVVATDTDVLTDETTFSFDKTKALVVSFAFGGASSIPLVGALGANYSRAFKAGNEAATTDVTGYSATAGENDLVTLVEVFG